MLRQVYKKTVPTSIVDLKTKPLALDLINFIFLKKKLVYCPGEFIVIARMTSTLSVLTFTPVLKCAK